jgi:hypothetical protein
MLFMAGNQMMGPGRIRMGREQGYSKRETREEYLSLT